VCPGARAEDLLFALGEGGGSDLADDPGANGGAAYSFGDVADHACRELLDGIGANVIGVRAFQVVTRTRDDL
jgi:hypothetical protein